MWILIPEFAQNNSKPAINNNENNVDSNAELAQNNGYNSNAEFAQNSYENTMSGGNDGNNDDYYFGKLNYSNDMNFIIFYDEITPEKVSRIINYNDMVFNKGFIQIQN